MSKADPLRTTTTEIFCLRMAAALLPLISAAALWPVAGASAAQEISQQSQAAPSRARQGSRDRQTLPGLTEHATDIVGDNLDRVAATADQLLGLLSKDVGLMVEFKRLLARDAGANGQILDESDFTDEAIADRLNADLHWRVLATQLLQRYGYLLPKLNPDSDLAAERNLAMQERTREITRAPERNIDSPRASSSERTATSCLGLSSNCGATGELPRPPAANPDRPGLDDRLPEPQVPNYSPAIPRADFAQPWQLLRSNSSEPESTEALLTALPATSNEEPANLANYRESDRAGELVSSTVATTERTLASSAPVQPPNSPQPNISRYAVERHPPSANAYANGAAAAFEPVPIVHLANPYADAPSLYDLYVQASPYARQSERFGLDVFQHGTLGNGILPMDLPVGPDYVVGPGDGLSIDLWGGVSQRLFRTVDREGRVLLPEAGPLLVSGKSLGEVQQSVQRVLRTQFRDVSADVSLLRLRTVRVYVVGEVAAPGAYDVSSLSTPLNALFAAGGVTAGGSLRNIAHFRGKDLLEEVDAYDLLLHGIRGDLQRLENGDSLRVPPLGPSVTVDGMVRRSAKYELHGEKNLNEVLDLAGGILPAAALRHIEVQRTEPHEKRTMLSVEVSEASDKDALRAALEKFQVQDGDEIHIFPIAPYNSDSIYLEGHVLRPGRYSYHAGMKLTDLVSSYDELLPEPAERYAEIVRIAGPDYRPTVQSFNLAAALERPETAPPLEPLDTVRIFGRYDLETPPEILVTGEVRAAGRYRLSGQEHLRDAIYQAGGVMPESWLDSAQLFRSLPDGGTKVFNVSLRDALAGDPLNNILVEPRDRILVHRMPERASPASVYIRGAVARPGRFPLAYGMRVSDLVLAAGGTLRNANVAGADLVHFEAVAASSASRATGEQTVDLASAIRSGGATDVFLHDGDVLTVPEQPGWKDVGATVTLRGEVVKPGIYGIEPGERLSSLLRRAGGLLPTAYPQAAVFERVEVRKVQEQSRQELIQRIEQEAVTVKTAVNASGTEEAALQQAATQQQQRIVDALRRSPVSGRLVVHIREGQRGFVGSPDDIELRAGDRLEIPKQPGFVLIVGQVYNSNAITYTPGKNAAWYLSRAGGATGLAKKNAIFILRASGSVTSGSGGVWSAGVLAATIGPGDTIVVPERAVVGGGVWKNLVAIAQIAQAGALAAAVAIP